MQLQQKLAAGIGRAGRRRRVLFGANATLMTLALLGILALANVLAARFPKRWDLTASGDFSLSPQTLQIIQGLKQPVRITGFFGRQDAASQKDVESRLKEYVSRGQQLSYRFVDPDTDPVAARNYNITSYGTLVVESGARRQQASGTDEQAITGAILKVISTRTTTIYFLTGQRERAFDDTARGGYSSARQLLEQDNFRVAPLNLTITTTVPLSDSVLVVADPQTALAAKEEQAISGYLSKGGRLLVLGNPLTPAPLPGLLGRAGLSWNNDLVVDQQSEPGNAAAPAVIQYPANPITKDLSGQASVFPTARTLTRAAQATGAVTITELLQSSQNSRAATNFANGQVQLGANDKPGPLTFGYSVEGPLAAPGAASSGTARLVVIGDADFASNGAIDVAPANGALFRNAVAWLAAQDQLIAIPAKAPVDRSVFLTAGQSRAVFYGSSLGLPLLVLVAGVGVWWRRR